MISEPCDSSRDRCALSSSASANDLPASWARTGIWSMARPARVASAAATSARACASLSAARQQVGRLLEARGEGVAAPLGARTRPRPRAAARRAAAPPAAAGSRSRASSARPRSRRAPARPSRAAGASRRAPSRRVLRPTPPAPSRPPAAAARSIRASIGGATVPACGCGTISRRARATSAARASSAASATARVSSASTCGQGASTSATPLRPARSRCAWRSDLRVVSPA